MKRISLATFLLFSTLYGAFAQQSGTRVFLALMQPQNETPPISDASSGNVIIWAHGTLDANGAVSSGTIDFDVQAKFSGPVTVTGLHIRNGAAGAAGPIVIPTDVNGADKSITVDSTGRVHIFKQVQVPSVTPPAISLQTIADLLANPQNYYVNIQTATNSAGAMRGQLVPADARVLMGFMSTANEVPPANVSGSGVASVLVLRGRAADGSVPLATAIFNLDYQKFDAGTIFTGFHIHNGAAGVNGPVIINTGLSGTNTVTVDSTGAGNLNFTVPMSPLDASFATEVATVNSLFTTPANQYINIHTTQFPGGVMRDQMHPTEDVNFQVNMSPANETPPITGSNGSGPSSVQLFLARANDGSVQGGTVLYDINYRGFPAPTTITGLHIHQAAAGVAGGIVIQSGVDANAGKVVTDTGSGNIFKFYNVTTSAELQALNGIVSTPNNFYVNLHTTVNPGGAMRDQLAPALAKPVVTGIAANASTITTAAPGSIVSIYGNNLSPITSALDGFGGISALATSMNGVTVTIGGVKAPFYYVGASQINAEVPVEVAAGAQPVIVTNSTGSVTTTLNVAPTAPSIFDLDGKGTGAVVKNADFSLITPTNTVKAGDVIVIYMTGLGQTTPPMQTGVLLQPPARGFNNTAPVTVTISGINAPVAYSIASPGFVGLYQVAVTVPSGVSGNVPLVVKSGIATSNSVTLAVQ